MKPHILIAAVCLLVSFFITAHAQKSPGRKFKVCDIYVQPGFILQGNADASIADFRLLAPQSFLANNNFDGYEEKSDFNPSGTGMFSVLLGFQFSDKQTPILRLGASYYGGKTLSLGYQNSVKGHYDTLISTQSGQGIILDSSNSKNYSFNYFTEQIRFDVSLVFRVLPKSRVSLFAGVGLTAGYSLDSRTEIKYENSISFDHAYSQATYVNSSVSNYTEKKEKFINKNNFCFSAYVPLGIDFRLGRKREFFKRIHLFYELRPGVNISPIAELRTITSASLQNGLGLRVFWN